MWQHTPQNAGEKVQDIQKLNFNYTALKLTTSFTCKNASNDTKVVPSFKPRSCICQKQPIREQNQSQYKEASHLLSYLTALTLN